MDRVKPENLPPLPPRPAESHKGTFGTVWVHGGCRTMPGAPALVARAAFRTGVGLVKISTDEDAMASVLTIEPSATGVVAGRSLDDTDPKSAAVLAVGPGWGEPRERVDRLRELLRSGRAMVIDADGLNALALLACHIGKDTVLTPHPGEFARLAKAYGLTVEASNREAAAAELARCTGAVVLLKGHGTVVTDGQRVYLNDTGNAALATAGSGDVLTGVIAALRAQGLSAFDAAAWGARLHGLAAQAWSKRHGESGLLARELADELPGVMRAETA